MKIKAVFAHWPQSRPSPPPRPAHSQNFPDQPVKIRPGLPGRRRLDTPTRMIVPKLSEVLGQQVVVENRTGAGGYVGAQVVARRPPTATRLRLHHRHSWHRPGLTRSRPWMRRRIHLRRHDRREPEHPDGQPVRAREDAPRVHRVGEGPAAAAQLRRAERRRVAAPRDRTAQTDGRARDDECPYRAIRPRDRT